MIRMSPAAADGMGKCPRVPLTGLAVPARALAADKHAVVLLGHTGVRQVNGFANECAAARLESLAVATAPTAAPIWWWLRSAGDRVAEVAPRRRRQPREGIHARGRTAA